jgi:hypothetical protein
MPPTIVSPPHQLGPPLNALPLTTYPPLRANHLTTCTYCLRSLRDLSSTHNPTHTSLSHCHISPSHLPTCVPHSLSMSSQPCCLFPLLVVTPLCLHVLSLCNIPPCVVTPHLSHIDTHMFPVIAFPTASFHLPADHSLFFSGLLQPSHQLLIIIIHVQPPLFPARAQQSDRCHVDSAYPDPNEDN